MDQRAELSRPPSSEAAEAVRQDGDSRAPYQPPRLEHLGPWQAFTLQQTVPIFP